MIVEKSSFQKVYFSHGFQISKFMHRFGCEKTVLPFFSKNAISGVRMQTEQIGKLLGSKYQIQKCRNPYFSKIK